MTMAQLNPLSVRGPLQSRPAQGGLPGFIRLGASVGAGGRNQAEDVRNVQIALNAVSPFWAGPDPMLDEDGLSGPKTIAAIRRIQSKWTQSRDGRVDPGGPTIRVLNRLAGVVPPTGPAASSLSLS